MLKTIKLITVQGTEKEVSFLSTGTTAIRFKQIFHKDLMPSITKLLKDEDLNPDADLIVGQELAFVMNKQAEGRNMNTVTYEEYLTWIDEYDSASLFQNIADFIKIYTGSRGSTSEPKKEEEP